MFPTVDSEDISQVTSTESLNNSRDAQNSPESSQVESQNNNRDLTINMLLKETVLCLALAITAYGALHNTPIKISKHPQAVRFFSQKSVVVDWYRGQLSEALTAVHHADISFVMYYAPWDAESQYVRGEFEKAASVLSDRVHFAAINCWNPGSECRKQHNKIPSWPILMAYTVTSKGIFYKGPHDAESIINFLELIMKPLQRVASMEDLVHLLSICDVVAVGFTPISDSSKYYNVWYRVAIKSLEFDTIGEICFAVVTSEDLAVDLGVENLPNARLMLWNHTKEFFAQNTDLKLWKETSLMHWVLENFAQPVARILPMWKKAYSFERYSDGNPILILFTPLNPLYEQLSSYSLLREIAMEYYNCKNNESNQWTAEIIKLQHVQRLLYQQKSFIKFCQEFKLKKTRNKQNFKKVVESQNNKYPWNNSTQKNHKSGVYKLLSKRGILFSGSDKNMNINSQLLSSLDFLEECGAQSLPAEQDFYKNYGKCQIIEDNLNYNTVNENVQINTETTMLPLEDDQLAAEQLTQDSIRHFCKLMKFAYTLSPPVYLSKSSEDKNNVSNINGLACAENFTLHILAIDSTRNHHFAESLGINITKKKDMTAVVILDSKMESQYVLEEDYSAKSVRDFIFKFTYKKLKRFLRSREPGAKYTHYYGAADEGAKQDRNSLRVIDLTSRSFRRVVEAPGTLTLVAVCGGGCGGGWARAALLAARLLSAAGLPARAARLDARLHDLPWHYTVPRHPTLLVFSALRGEAESHVYPHSARITISGAVALALRSLDPPHRLHVRLALCRLAQVSNEKKICLRDTREHITSIIGKHLKHWRHSEQKELKDALLKRLQHLHRVSLELSVLHYTDLRESNTKHLDIMNSLKNLSQNWQIDDSLQKSNVSIPRGVWS